VLTNGNGRKKYPTSNLQCQTVSKITLWGWTFMAFKTSRNWGVFN